VTIPTRPAPPLGLKVAAAAVAAVVLTAGIVAAVVRAGGGDGAATGPPPSTTSSTTSSNPPSATGPTTAPGPASPYAELEAQIASVRGLEWLTPPDVRVVSKADLAAEVRRIQQRDHDPDDEADTEALLKLLGQLLDFTTGKTRCQ